MSFFVKAAVEALKAFPAVNARIDGNEIVYQNFYDIGVAVSTEQGSDGAGASRRRSPHVRRDREGDRRIWRTRPATARSPSPTSRAARSRSPTAASSARCCRRRSSTRRRAAILGMHAIKKRPVVVNDQIVDPADDVPRPVLRPPARSTAARRSAFWCESRTAWRIPRVCCLISC